VACVSATHSTYPPSRRLPSLSRRAAAPRHGATALSLLLAAHVVLLAQAHTPQLAS